MTSAQQAIDPHTKAIVSGPASTPQINHHPALFNPDHLFPLLANDDERSHTRRRASRYRKNQDSARATLASQAQPSLEINEENQEVFNQSMHRWGLFLVGSSTIAFVLGLWSILIGPFVDTQHYWFLNAMAKDTHYKYLFIFLVPVTLYAVIINWWGLKIFRHA